MPEPAPAPLKLELSSEQGIDKYVIDTRIEIVFILRAIMQRRTRVTIYFDRGGGFILTFILGIDAERGKMVVDHSPNEELNRKVLRAEELTFITFLDQVKIQFACHGIENTRFEGRDSFSVSIPQRLLRRQRRQYYRIAAPAIDPLKCTIPLPVTDRGAEVIVLDISCGGIAVIDPHSNVDFEPGATYDNCRIVLPGIGTLNFTLRVRTTSEVTLKNGLICKRSGCEFVAMPEKMLAMVQGYIMKLERERKARQTRLK